MKLDIIHPEVCLENYYDYTFTFCPKLKKLPSYEQEYLGQIQHWINTQKVDINHKDHYERTMLSYACESNYLEVVRYLLKNNAKIELKNYEPLCDACHVYNIEMIKILIEHGANMNVKDYEGNSPFHWILRCGKDDENMIDLLQLFVKHGLDITSKDNEGDSYLHLSTRYGYLWTSRELIKFGAKIDSRNNKGNTVLLNCCESSWGWNIGCFRLVLQKAGRISLKDKNNNGNTTLHIAARNGLVPLVRFLCSNVDIEAKNNDGNTPIMEACYNNRNVTIIQHLIAFEASLNVENNSGLTPLQLALINYNLDIVYVLLSRLQKKQLINSISELIPQLSEVVDEMNSKKINLDKIEKEDQPEK